MSVLSPSPVARSNLAVMPAARLFQMTALGLGEHVAPLVPLGEGQVQVAVLATQLADLGPDPDGVGQALLDDRP